MNINDYEKDSKKEKSIYRSIKIKKSEMDIIRKNADKYCEGNMSKFLRFLGMNFKPQWLEKEKKIK